MSRIVARAFIVGVSLIPGAGVVATLACDATVVWGALRVEYASYRKRRGLVSGGRSQEEGK